MLSRCELRRHRYRQYVHCKMLDYPLHGQHLALMSWQNIFGPKLGDKIKRRISISTQPILQLQYGIEPPFAASNA
jgi:hypothetical protein